MKFSYGAFALVATAWIVDAAVVVVNHNGARTTISSNSTTRTIQSGNTMATIAPNSTQGQVINALEQIVPNILGSLANILAQARNGGKVTTTINLGHNTLILPGTTLSGSVPITLTAATVAHTTPTPPRQPGHPAAPMSTFNTTTRSSTSNASATANTPIITSSSSSSPASTSASTTSTSTAAATTGFDLSSTFISSMLSYHNQYRAIHSAAALTWDTTKAAYAQTYASKCNFTHSHGPYGENLAIGGYSNPDYYVWLWYNERNSYTNYTNPDFDDFEEWGHFTQVVWKGATSVGCGYVNTCTNFGNYGPYYLVCEYDTGNVLPASNFVSNVATPTASEPAAPTGMDSSYAPS